MKRTRQEKAITLIALIITIVVLLILAVVAINAVTGDGIIQHATNAKTSYENAQAKEQGVLSYYETYLETEGQVGKWIQNKTKVTRVNEDGTVDELEVGDVVNYIATDSAYGDATEEKWAVLGAENGKIILVSTINVSTKELGVTDYINDTAIETLNIIGADYDDGTGAVPGSGRSINVDDINRVTGYNPLKTGNGKIYKEGEVGQYLNKVTYTIQNGKVCYTSTVNSTLTETESTSFTKLNKEELGEGDSIIIDSNFYDYYPVSLSLEDSSTDGEVKGISAESKAYELLFERKDSKYYWLASSFEAALENGGAYGLFIVYTNFTVTGCALWRTDMNLDTSDNGVRAVVSLNSNVKFTPDENNTNTYNISVAE